MGVASDDSGFSFPKNLSVWWSEETEYVLQRIERWAAYARGYNRLRSVESTWAPSFRNRRHNPPPVEQSRLRCCALGNLDYKSNGNLDSNCLEAYSLDHSIYFKTIGEIRSESRGQEARAAEPIASPDGSSKKSTPIDCGDFLSSDFDDDDDDLAEIDDADFDLREQLDQLEAAFGNDNRNDVIQVCRSALNEDEINNNIMRLGFPRKFAPQTAAAQ